MNRLDGTQVISADERNGNLHITLEGRFGVDTAMLLSSRINQRYRGAGNIFIHTAQITAVSPQSKEMFSSMLGVFNLPRENICFVGEKGMEICHNNSKVIMKKRKIDGHKSCGNCKSCKCRSLQSHR